MNKELYLKRLRSLIRALPDEERRTILDFYREIIEDKIENGQSEAQAVAELGDVHVLAQKILIENPNRKPADAGKIVGIALASFFGVIVVAMITVALFGFVNFSGKVATGSVTTLVRNETQGEKIFTAPVSGVSSISIEAENKEVNVVAADSDEITIGYVENQDEDYSIHNENGTITLINQSRSLHDFSFPNFHWGEDDSKRITVQVPRKYADKISINTTNSVIRISDFSSLGDLSCKTTNSLINISKVEADNIMIETQNAAITLDDTKAGNRLSAQTQNGKISLNQISAQDIVLQTQNGIIGGTIDGAESDYTIVTRTTNAISNLQNRFGGSKKLTASTTNAIISIDFAD